MSTATQRPFEPARVRSYKLLEARPTSALIETTAVVGRVLLIVLFLVSGMAKVSDYSATLHYMADRGVPGYLLPPAIALELLGALCIVFGWKVRLTAVLLAGYTLLAGLLFHLNFTSQIEFVLLLKDVSIAGGFLLLAANGAGLYSIDAREPAR